MITERAMLQPDKPTEQSFRTGFGPIRPIVHVVHNLVVDIVAKLRIPRVSPKLLSESGVRLHARQARGEYLNPSEVQIVHTVQRCVRRAFLCGTDPLSRKSFEHRRQWIRERSEFLASVFAIDCVTYTVLSNHLHIVLRSRPDVAAEWSAEEVARRWLRLFPQRRDQDDQPAEPTEAELELISGNAKKLDQIRTRLSDISWWMRCTAENIARQANREEDCTGRFWNGWDWTKPTGAPWCKSLADYSSVQRAVHRV